MKRRTFSTPFASVLRQAVRLACFSGFIFLPLQSFAQSAVQGADVGAVGVAGSDSASGATLTVSGAGADIGGAADAFHFRYQSLAGDGGLKVRVPAIATGGNAWAKLGLMIRADLTAGAPNVLFYRTAGLHSGYQSRATAGGATTTVDTGLVENLPQWLWLDRKGNDLHLYQSADGAQWTAVGTVTLNLPATAYFGLAVSSHNNATAYTATFDNFSLTSGTPYPPNMPPATPTNLRVTANPTTTDVQLAWDDNSGDETGFVLIRGIGIPGQTYNNVSFALPANTTSYVDASAAAGMTYSYTIAAARPPYQSPASAAAMAHTATATAAGWAESSIAGANFGYASTTNPDLLTVASNAGPAAGVADRGQLLFRRWSGDGELLAYVSPTSSSSSPTARFGVMFRASLAADAPFADMALTSTNATFDSRSTAGGNQAGINGAAVGLSYWVRLARVGNLLTGSISPDGTAWTTVGSATVALGTEALVGLFAQGDGSHLADGSFVHLTLPGQVAPPGLPAPSGLMSDASSSTEIQLRWTDQSSDETGFEVEWRDHNYGAFTRRVTLPPNTVSYTDATYLYPNASYDYRVRAVRNSYVSDYSNVAVASTLPANTSNWSGADVGTRTASGSSTTSSDGGTFTVRTTGGSIGGPADSGRLQFRQWTGDGSLIAHVASLTNTDPGAQAGLMFRTSFAAGSPNVALLLAAGQPASFQARSGTDGATDATAVAGATVPAWLKLTRAGNDFTAFVSPDGTTWTQVGTKTVALNSTVYLGLAASSHNASAEATAVFDHVLFPSATSSTALAPPSNLQAVATAGNAVHLTWADNTIDETGFELFRGESSGDATILVGAVGANVTSFDDVTVRPSTAYYYYMRSRRGSDASASAAYANVTTPASSTVPPGAPRYAQADGATVNSLRLTWVDASSDETGFEIYQGTYGTNYLTYLASVPANTVEFTDTGLAADTTYLYIVRAVRGGSYSGFTSRAAGKTQPVTVLGQWTGSYVGAPGSAGSDSGSPPAVTLNAVGDDIEGASDHFRYYYRALDGDTTIVARVASFTAYNSWAKAGVMIRGTLDSNSAHVSMLFGAPNNAIFEVRPTTGAGTTKTTGAWVSAPYWVKLTRAGNTFTGYVSPDGAAWTQVGTATVSLPSTVYVGVAASPHDSRAATVAFDHLAATGNAAPPPPAMPAYPTDLTVGTVTATSIHLDWLDHANNEDGFRIYRVGGTSHDWSLLNTVGANVTSYDDTTVTPDTNYGYYVNSFKGTQESPIANSVSVTTPGGATPPVTGLQVDSPTSSSLRLTWTDTSSGETGFDLERATGSGAFAHLTTVAANATTYTDTGLTADTSYSYRLRAVPAYAAYSNTATGHTSAATPPPPEGWSGGDIGTTGSAGAESGTPPTVTMHAGGADIYGPADSFHYFAQVVTGDVTIVARVASLTNTNAWAKAGVMIRATADANSANAAMLLSPAQVCSFQSRATAGAATQVTTGAYVTPPEWVKLTRVGNTFTGYFSSDGIGWVQVGVATITLPDQVYIGLAASSHNASAQTVAAFDHVAITGGTLNPPPPVTPAAPGSLAVSGFDATEVSLTWTDNSDNEDGFELYRQTGSATAVLIGTLAANLASVTDTSVAAGTSYVYSLKAFAGTQRSASSNSVSVTTPAANSSPVVAPASLQVDGPTATSLHLSWTDNSSDETGFDLERAIGSGGFAHLATLAANLTTYTDTGLAADTGYSYRLRAVRNTTYSAYSNTGSGHTQATTTPSGWSSGDIGATGSTGSDSGTPPTLTMNAGGADIYGTADSFRYASQTLSGDGTIVARVVSLNNTNSWAKAGVMFRATLAADSANAAMLLSPAQVCSFQARPAAAAATQVTTGAWVNPPYWVKLTRAGNTFTGYISPDGATWTLVGTQDIAMPAQVYVGVCASAHASVQTVASFDFINVTGGTGTPPPPPPPPAWTQQNLGTGTGSFTVDTTLALNATSGDIYDASDSGVFVYQSWTGNSEFVAKVDALTNSNTWAKGGVMFRAALDAGAVNAFVAITVGQGAVFQARSTAGGASATISHSWTPGPGSWVKLVRTGGTITAAWSTDGVAWNSLGSVSDVLPATIYVGFAASSHNSAAATTATFSSFSVH